MSRKAEARRQTGANEAETRAPAPDRAAKEKDGARVKRQSPSMAGKRGLIMGVANERSIAWGIASAVSAQGAALAFTYQGEALAKRVRPLAESVGSDIVLPCDVSDDASIDSVFEEIEARWGGLDFLVHAIAYSDKEELKGKYVDTSRGNLVKTLDIP